MPPPTPPIFRPACPADLPDLLALVHMLARHHGDTPALRITHLARDLFGPVPWIHVLVAEKARRLVGYAALLPLAQMQHGHRGMDLHHLFVISRLRGTGLGRALVAASLTRARDLGCSYVTVTATEDNNAAQQFYQKAGFAPRPYSGCRFRAELSQDTPTSAL